jgi:hypothetical protein
LNLLSHARTNTKSGGPSVPAAKDGSPSNAFNDNVLVSVSFPQNTNGNVYKPLGRWRS